jgi:4-hydroxybenzoate polyprenyltransferase
VRLDSVDAPGVRASLSVFLRAASCRFAAFYFIPFFAGLTQRGRATILFGLFGAAYWLVQSLAIEVTNRLADRTEDAINRPERTALCELVGWDNLVRAQRWLWGALLALDAAWLLVDGNAALAVLLGAGACMGLVYSVGPRLARRRWFAFITISTLFGGSFLIGWATGGASDAHAWHQLATDVAFATAIGVFIVAFAGIKDLTDRDGDVRIGYESLFVALVRRRSGVALLALALAPCALIVVLALAGALPQRLLLLAGWAPCSLLIARAVRGARSTEDQMAVRELFYLYWLAFTSCAVLLFVPDAGLAIAVAGACLYWALATRWLHWAPALTHKDVRRVLRRAPAT